MNLDQIGRKGVAFFIVVCYQFGIDSNI